MRQVLPPAGSGRLGKRPAAQETVRPTNLRTALRALPTRSRLPESGEGANSESSPPSFNDDLEATGDRPTLHEDRTR